MTTANTFPLELVLTPEGFVPERIFFHLVESRDEEFPFAFLATYATRGENDRIKLLELLSCLNRAAEAVPLIGEFMSTGELFHPLRLTAEEAYELLSPRPCWATGRAGAPASPP